MTDEFSFSDVTILSSMGEQVCMDVKEAPKGN